MQQTVFITLLAMILVQPVGVLAQETDSDTDGGGETTTTTPDPANLGFQVDLIEVVDDAVALEEQFESGISGIHDTHQINYEECKAYNQESEEGDGTGTDDPEDADVVDSEDTAVEDISGGTGEDSLLDDAGNLLDEIVSTCSIEEDGPMVHIQWSVDSSLVNIGYEWTVKIGSCSGTELMESDTDCVLVEDLAQSLSKSGNHVELPLSKLIGTLNPEDDEANVARNCCNSLEGLRGTVKLYFYTGFENDSTSVAYDVVEFSYDYDAPDVPSGVTVKENGETLTASWTEVSDSSDDITYSVYYATESFTEPGEATEVDAGNNASLILTGLDKDIPVYIRVGAKDGFNNVGALSEMYLATPRETLDGWELYKDQGGGEEGGFCFIATAAYGSYMHPYVAVLRDFRDQVLLPTSWGAAFVQFYYREGSAWAAWIANRPWARRMAQVALIPLVALAFFLVGFGPFAQLAIVLSIYGLFRSLGVYLKRRYPGCRRSGPVFRV